MDVLNGCFPCENSVKYLDHVVKTMFLLLCQIEERVDRDKPFWEITLLRLDMMAMVSLSSRRKVVKTNFESAFLMKNVLFLICVFCLV